MLIYRVIFLIQLIIFPLAAKDLFMVITPEKTGTHLLLKAVSALTRMEPEHDWHRDLHEKLFHINLRNCEKNKTYCHMHIPAAEKYIAALKTRKYKAIFLMRDPRDQLLSMVNYIREKNWKYEGLCMQSSFARMPFEEQIEEMITGKHLGTCVPRVLIGWKMPWMFLVEPQVLTVRYENLVGPKGGGSKEAQEAELTAIANFLRIKVAKNTISAIADCLYGKPGEATFHTGKIGNWKSAFNEWHKKLFKEVFGDELILLGYESDYDW